MKPLSAVHLWVLLWRAAHAVETVDRRIIAALGLCGSDFGILEVLLHKGPLPVNVIGKKILLTSGSITTAVDRLARKGLVRREPSPGDGRSVLVALTSTGEALISQACPRHAMELEPAFSVLSREERSTLAALLKKLGKHAETLSSEAVASDIS